MARSRQRLADFEARSVQLIAACTLGLAGMSALQATPFHRASGASTPIQSTTTASVLPANTRSVPTNPTTAASRSGRT